MRKSVKISTSARGRGSLSSADLYAGWILKLMQTRSTQWQEKKINLKNSKLMPCFCWIKKLIKRELSLFYSFWN